MRRITPICLAALAAVALAAMPAPAADVPLGTEFTYQGRLTSAGTAVDEPIDVRVRLYDAATAGLQIGSELEYLAVPVAGGVFTVDLDFGLFGNNARWLEIDVKLTGGGAYETLAPRQPILPTPVSMFAFAAPNSGPFLFNGGDAVFDGGDVGVGTTDPDARLHVAAGDSGVTASGGSQLVLETSGADNFLSMIAPDSARQAILFGDTTHAADGGIQYNRFDNPNGLNFHTNGNVPRMVIDDAGNVGIGTTNPLTPLDVRGTSAWPVRITSPLNPGINIKADGAASSWAMYHDSATDDLNFRDSTDGATRMTITGDTGYVGIGTTNPDRRLTLYGTGNEFIGVQTPAQSGILFGKSAGETNGGILYNNIPDALSFRTLDNSTRMVLDATGRLGIGTTTPATKLALGGGSLWISGVDSGGLAAAAGAGIRIFNDASSGDARIYAYDYGTNTARDLHLGVNTEKVTVPSLSVGDKVGIGVTNPESGLTVSSLIPTVPTQPGVHAGRINFGGQNDSGVYIVGANGGGAQLRFYELGNAANGRLWLVPGTGELRLDGAGLTKLSVPKLEIRGGSDLVEGFETTDGATVEPGTVMIIDAAHPGALAVSKGAYDTKVAGVVSGAGGVEPGIHMGQDGIMDGETKVAMTGRVYVKCSCQNGAIAPGDLLTTADLAGHAMKATDRDRSHGAVIGKAMSTLDEGTGLVLVLVNLQ